MLSYQFDPLKLKNASFSSSLICLFNNHIYKHSLKTRNVNCSCAYSAYIVKPVPSGRNL